MEMCSWEGSHRFPRCNEKHLVLALPKKPRHDAESWLGARSLQHNSTLPQTSFASCVLKAFPLVPQSKDPHVLTVLRLIFVGRTELLDDLLFLGLHHGRVALCQLTEESWRLSVVSWGLGPHPAKQKAIRNLCNVQVMMSYLELHFSLSATPHHQYRAPEISGISNPS